MAYDVKNNTGSLFRNTKKETDNHPDYNGSALIGGEEYFISAWVKESREGKKYFSFSFKAKNPPKEATRTVDHEANPFDDGDSLPF